MEVVLVKRWFLLFTLVLFTLISVAALHGLAKNIAQKRDLLSDPLCKVLWRRGFAGDNNVVHARKARKPKKTGNGQQVVMSGLIHSEKY